MFLYSYHLPTLRTTVNRSASVHFALFLYFLTSVGVQTSQTSLSKPLKETVVPAHLLLCLLGTGRKHLAWLALEGVQCPTPGAGPPFKSACLWAEESRVPATQLLSSSFPLHHLISFSRSFSRCPRPFLRSIHPRSTSVHLTSITWVNAADSAPLKVTTSNCSQLRFNKSMNIYQNTCLHPETKCSFLLSLWGPWLAKPCPLAVCCTLFGTWIKWRFWHCWSCHCPCTLVPNVCNFLLFISPLSVRYSSHVTLTFLWRGTEPFSSLTLTHRGVEGERTRISTCCVDTHHTDGVGVFI